MASSFSCTLPWRSRRSDISSSDIGSANLALISSYSLQQIDDRLHALFDNLPDGLCWIELRLLFEEADREARRNSRLALKFLIDAGEYPQQRTLSGTVQSDDADLRAIEIRQVDVLEDSFLVVVLADSNHGVDDFVGNCAHVEGAGAAEPLATLSGSETRQRFFFGFVHIKNGVQLRELKQVRHLTAGIAQFQLAPWLAILCFRIAGKRPSCRHRP